MAAIISGLRRGVLAHFGRSWFACSGAPWPLLKAVRDGGQARTAGWLARRWRATADGVSVLVALVAGLAIITRTGVYAQLVAAHVGDRGAAT